MNEALERILERLSNIHRVVKTDEDAEWNRAIYKSTEIVQEVAEEYNGGWIPCSERLPDVEADVLLSLRSLDVYTGFMSNTEGHFYVDGEGYVEFENVLAWQPLPEPFKESD